MVKASNDLRGFVFLDETGPRPIWRPDAGLRANRCPSSGLKPEDMPILARKQRAAAQIRPQLTGAYTRVMEWQDGSKDFGF